MTYVLGYSSEAEYDRECALEARNARLAAEACNEILTMTQASVLRLAMEAMPEIAAVLAEDAFEAYGWPADKIDECWLDKAGRATWAVFQRYRRAT